MTYTIESAIEALKTGTADLEDIMLSTNWEPIYGENDDMSDGLLIPNPSEWHADDGNAEITLHCDSGEEAAQEYVDGGEWDGDDETFWVPVHVWREAINAQGDIVRVNEAGHKIKVHPQEPPCIEGEEHNWQSPLRLVGGLKENPGVFGHGGSVTITEVCMNCGCEQFTDHWAQDRNDGQQGLTSVSYTPDKYRDQLTIRLTERWEEIEDGKLALSLTDENGDEVAGAIYDPETDNYDTTSDGCGITCSERHPAYRLLTQMDKNGEWPSAPSAEYKGNLTLEPAEPARRRR